MILLAIGLIAYGLKRQQRADAVVLAFCGVVLGVMAIPSIRAIFESSLPWHMVGHIVVMFVVPLFAGWAIARHRPMTVRWPWMSAVSLNVVMVAGHMPRIFDFVMTNGWWAVELMNVAFFVSGLWFFLCIWQSTTALRWSIMGVIATMAVMLFLAMAMSIFSSTPWYSSMASMPGMVMADDFSSQQLAAAILWICGDLWAVPMLVLLLRRVIEREGSLLGALQRYSEPPSRR